MRRYVRFLTERCTRTLPLVTFFIAKKTDVAQGAILLWKKNEKFDIYYYASFHFTLPATTTTTAIYKNDAMIYYYYYYCYLQE